MSMLKPKRYTMKYEDDDQITDFVIGADNTEYVVTMSGKEWRDYDWIFETFEPTARRMADYSHFVHLQFRDECTHSMTLIQTSQYFVDVYHGRIPMDETEIPADGRA